MNRPESIRSGFRLNHQATAFSKIEFHVRKRRGTVIKLEARSVRFQSVQICGECDLNLLTLQHTATHADPRLSGDSWKRGLQEEASLPHDPTLPQYLAAHHSATGCNGLQHSAAHCTTPTDCNRLQHTATHCSTLYHTATHCTALQQTATDCNRLQQTVIDCNTLQHTVPHCNTLQHFVRFLNDLVSFEKEPSSCRPQLQCFCRPLTCEGVYSLLQLQRRCNILQHTATHCNTLQHTAAHCNTLQHTVRDSNHCWHPICMYQKASCAEEP